MQTDCMPNFRNQDQSVMLENEAENEQQNSPKIVHISGIVFEKPQEHQLYSSRAKTKTSIEYFEARSSHTSVQNPVNARIEAK